MEKLRVDLVTLVRLPLGPAPTTRVSARRLLLPSVDRISAMPRIERSSLVVLVLGLLAGSAGAQEPIRLARTPDISPDGKSIAFSYLGDIWKVETIGGIAQPITSHPAHDLFPVFSPDGKSIAFSSNRHGSYDVFVVSSHGGRPRRL